MADNLPDSGFLNDKTLDEQLADLDRIAEMGDPVLRNLLITQRYHDLSQELTRVLGKDNANWSTFACWASKTAGQSIRKEEIPKELVEFLRDEAQLEQKVNRFYDALGPVTRSLLPRLTPFDLARCIITEVASQIAEGNLRVYAELAPLFAKFVSYFADPASRTPEQSQAFIDQLKPGPASTGGQGDLKKAFVAYLQASVEEEPKQKAQLILYGNVLIGLHEQTRLQKNIAGGINAPFSDAVYEHFFSESRFFLRVVLRWLARGAVRLFAGEFKDDWQRIATRFMMKLSAPNGGQISLGKDLPPGEFAPELVTLNLRELIELLSTYDKDLNSTKGSAAVDWVKLGDRMRFIGELFRVEQKDHSWFKQPFSDPQRKALEQGILPAGPLG